MFLGLLYVKDIIFVLFVLHGNKKGKFSSTGIFFYLI